MQSLADSRRPRRRLLGAERHRPRLPGISVVVPVYNEQDNLEPLFGEIDSVLTRMAVPWEVVFIDDGSTDGSPGVLADLKRSSPHVRVLTFTRNCGQSAAFDAGFQASNREVVVTMDADMQNDPQDIPMLVAHLEACDVVCGQRAKRQDNLVRKISSRVANRVRAWVIGDSLTDIACALKAYRGEVLDDLKLHRGMHRFFPVLLAMEGCRITQVPVNHRPRYKGTAKYGIRNRALPALLDMLAVRWMQDRYIQYEARELTK